MANLCSSGKYSSASIDGSKNAFSDAANALCAAVCVRARSQFRIGAAHLRTFKLVLWVLLLNKVHAQTTQTQIKGEEAHTLVGFQELALLRQRPGFIQTAAMYMGWQREWCV